MILRNLFRYIEYIIYFKAKCLFLSHFHLSIEPLCLSKCFSTQKNSINIFEWIDKWLNGSLLPSSLHFKYYHLLISPRDWFQDRLYIKIHGSSSSIVGSPYPRIPPSMDSKADVELWIERADCIYLRKNMPISGPTQFKPLLFKCQLYMLPEQKSLFIIEL